MDRTNNSAGLLPLEWSRRRKSLDGLTRPTRAKILLFVSWALPMACCHVGTVQATQIAGQETVVEKTKVPKLSTIVSFTGNDGAYPRGSLFMNSAGDLFGTTEGGPGGPDFDGTVFEIVKTKGIYSNTPTTLVKFNYANGATPFDGLIADASGNLFGTTEAGGTNNDGTVFEIVKTKGGYADAPTTLVSFTGTDGSGPEGDLIADAAGDLFGTTAFGGANNNGTVFEVTKSDTGYSAPITLVSFPPRHGQYPDGPFGGLFMDPAGNLFGTTYGQGANSKGTVFEIAKTNGGYADSPTTLVSFTGADGSGPECSLIADAAGNLFGTAPGGGKNGEGTVFEIRKTQGGYASKPTTLVSFGGVYGSQPLSALIIDAAGNLFGTTPSAGAFGSGTAFEIFKTQKGYTNKPNILLDFTTVTGGAIPHSSLIANAAGDLFGTAVDGGGGGGDEGYGTVFKITQSGYVTKQVLAEATGAAAKR